MALTKFTTDVENIQALSNKPNEVEGLTADQLKAKFDKAGEDIKTYLNSTLSSELDTSIGTLQTDVTTLNGQIGNKYDKSGWHPSGGTASYVSATSLSLNLDATPFINKGMKLKYEQSESLTGYWSFNTNSTPEVGGFTMANVGTPTYTAGKFGNALTLNGTDQALSITDTASLKPTGAFTIGCWVKTGTTGTVKKIFQSYSLNTNAAGFQLNITTENAINTIIGKNTGTTSGVDFNSITGTTNVCDNQWHYVVLTFNNNFAQIYVDGKLEASNYAVTPAYAATNYVRIGCANFTGTNADYMSGQIDDLFLINGYALDETTIWQKYIANAAQGSGALTVTKNAIVTNVALAGSTTTFTIYNGTDFALSNSAISNLSYSSLKAPYGFPTNPDKWSVIVEKVLDVVQSTPISLTWYNLGGTINVPIGLWKVSYQTSYYTVKGSTAFASASTTLSTTNNGATIANFTNGVILPVSDLIGMIQSAELTLNYITNQILYLNFRVLYSDTASIRCASYGTTILKAVCAYL